MSALSSITQAPIISDRKVRAQELLIGTVPSRFTAFATTPPERFAGLFSAPSLFGCLDKTVDIDVERNAIGSNHYQIEICVVLVSVVDFHQNIKVLGKKKGMEANGKETPQEFAKRIFNDASLVDIKEKGFKVYLGNWSVISWQSSQWDPLLLNVLCQPQLNRQEKKDSYMVGFRTHFL